MSQQVESGVPVNITSTSTVSVASGTLLGFFVNSTTGGTIVLRSGSNGTSGGTAFTGTITPAAGVFHRLPAYCVNGLHATIANTINVTFFFAAG